MVNSLIKMSWNALALAAVASLVWIGIGWVERKADPPEPEIVVSSSAIVTRIRDVAQLVTVQQDLNIDVAYSEVPQGWLQILGQIGIKENSVIQIPGTVSAGFDLSKMTERDIWISPDGQRIQITLPSPEIFSDTLYLEQSRILGSADFCPDRFLCKGELDKYKSVIVPEAKRQLREAAQSSQLLERAARNGRAMFTKLFGALGTVEVRVVVHGYSAE